MNTPASASAYQRLPSHGRDAVSYDKQTALLTQCYIIVSTAITNRKSANRSHLGVMAVSLVAEIKRLSHLSIRLPDWEKTIVPLRHMKAAWPVQVDLNNSCD